MYSSLKLERSGKARRVVQLLGPGVTFGGLKVKAIRTVRFGNKTTVIVQFVDSSGEEFVWDIYDHTFRSAKLKREIVAPDDVFKQHWRGTLGGIIKQAEG